MSRVAFKRLTGRSLSTSNVNEWKSLQVFRKWKMLKVIKNEKLLTKNEDFVESHLKHVKLNYTIWPTGKLISKSCFPKYYVTNTNGRECIFREFRKHIYWIEYFPRCIHHLKEKYFRPVPGGKSSFNIPCF